MIKKRRVILLAIFLIMLATTGGYIRFAAAETAPPEDLVTLQKEIEARKQKIKDLEATIEKQKQLVNQKQLEATSLKNQLGILDTHISQVESDVNLVQAKIDQTELEIEALLLAVQNKGQIITRQKKIIGALIQNISRQEEKNYLEVLLTNKDLATFYDEISHLRKTNSELGDSVKMLKQTKNDLEIKKVAVEERKKTYADLQADLKEKQQDLREQANYKKKVLAETQSSEKKYRTIIENLKQQYQAVEGEVRNYEEKVRKKLAENKQNLGGPVGQFSWPVPSHYVTAGFHDASYPFRYVFEHPAIDIRASHGTPVRAAASGYVGRAKHCDSSSCYSYILLIHTGNFSTVYGHLSGISVREDQFVQRGDIIGYSGATPGTVGAGPFTTGPHLHFEVRKGGIPVNPVGYLE